MSSIDVCNDFVREVAPLVSEIFFDRKSRFTRIDHSVDYEEFVLKIYYVFEQFGYLIGQYANEMMSALKNRKKFYDTGWDVHNVIANKFEISCNYIRDTVWLIVKIF